MLREDLKPYEECVKKNVHVKLTSNQYNALVSFAYSLGTKKFAKSSVVIALNAEDYDGAKKQMNRYVMANGKKVKGLVTRRNYESALFGLGYNDLNRE